MSVFKQEIIDSSFGEDLIFLDTCYDNALIGVCGIHYNFTTAYNMDKVLGIISEMNDLDKENSFKYFIQYLMKNNPEVSFVKIKKGSREELAEVNEEMLFIDGYSHEKCCIGLLYKEGNNIVAVYDDTACVEDLISNETTEEDAIEWFEYNTRGAYAGENTPAYISLYINNEPTY